MGSKIISLLFILISFSSPSAVAESNIYLGPDQSVDERKFIQEIPEKFQNSGHLEGAECFNLEIDSDGVVFVRTDRGVARLFKDQLALDQSFRPLAERKPQAIAVQQGKLFYLYEDELLSNGFAGEVLAELPPKSGATIAIGSDLSFVRAYEKRLDLHQSSGKLIASFELSSPVRRLYNDAGNFYCLSGRTLSRISGTNFSSVTFDHELTALNINGPAFFAGTKNGFYELPHGFSKTGAILHTNLPRLEITSFCSNSNQLWVGTTKGAFLWNRHGPSRYLASKRWLKDDVVKDLAFDFNGNLFILTQTGLTRIKTEWMSLNEKAKHYQEKIRQRHIRFGFCSELFLRTPGDPTSAEMIDTDNDGTWSNYYMASLAFRHGATGDETARQQAWETFAALERLEKINPLDGFPSRTFERKGFKYSDPDRWHPTENDKWDWKAHTSSDEVIAHTFGTTVMYQIVAKTGQEKARLSAFLKKIADHIIRNNWYLIDMDGKPTLWARWNPEYVNWFPRSIVDRKLNSAQIIGLLQSVYQMTGDDHYRQKAFELIEKHGYLENIMTPMSKISFTPGFVYQGNDMGDSWNHSDDLLGFISYWTLYHTAFNDELKKKYQEVIHDHWNIERHEQNPLWNFVYGSTLPEEFDHEKAVSTLQAFPLDMVAWDVQNSHRKDIAKLSPNFRGEQLKEFLRPDERQITRWNTQPFILDGGSGGRIEFGGDEFLLPYWMSRFHRLAEFHAAAQEKKLKRPDAKR
ncbi:MAG: hypothetical protein ACO1QB_18195 [Verrucomicrobiales bacterium]